jgi:hypothetical protein
MPRRHSEAFNEEGVMRIAWCAATLVAAGSWCAVAVTAAKGTDVLEFNFNTGPAGWSSPVGQWVYTAEGSNEKSWKLPLSGSNPPANLLVSPCLQITDPNVRFDLQQHRFSFGTSGTGVSIAYVPPAGQVQYTLDDGLTWHGVSLHDWYPFVGPGGGSDTPPTLNPAAFAPGTVTTLLPDGYAFQGVSRGFADKNPKFVRSAFELTGLTVGEIAFRLVGDLGGRSFFADPLHPIWDVNHVQIKGVVEGPCLPEPGGLSLAAVAAVAAVSSAAWRGRSRATRRRCHPACSAHRRSPGPVASG